MTTDEPQTPDYQRVCAVIRARIADGTYPPGHRLPSLAGIETELGVKRGPARQAYATLVAEGTVEGRERSGYFVPQPVTLRTTRRWYRRGAGSSFYADERAAGRVPGMPYRKTTTVRADDLVASLLSAEVGEEVTQTDYVFSSDGRPVMLSRSWELLRLTRGTDVEDPEGGWSADKGVLDRFDHIGVHATEVTERLLARPATPEEAAKLEIRPGAPILENARTYYAAALDTTFEAALVVTTPEYRQVYTLAVEGEPPARP